MNESHVVGVCGVGTNTPSGRASLCDRVMKLVVVFILKKNVEKTEKRAHSFLPDFLSYKIASPRPSCFLLLNDALLKLSFW